MQRRSLSARQAVLLDVVLVMLSAGTGSYRDLLFDPGRVRMVDLPTWCYAVVQLLGAVVLLARRRHPVRVVWVNAVLCLVSPTQSAYVAVYSLGAHARRSVPAVAGFIVLVVCWTLGAQQWRLSDPVTSLVLLGCGLLIGLWVQARRALLDSLTERARRAEHEQELAAELAGARYRARLAADVHDTVGHWVSLMVLQAGAVKVSTTDESTRQAAGTIESYGGQAITELRELLQELPAGAGTPGEPESLAELVERARRGGVSVTMHTRGYPEPQDESVARVAYRVVQEGLTNVTKHAPDSDVVVVVDRRPRETVVEVTNSSPHGVVVGDDSGGTGLIGLRARIGLVAGRLDAHPLADGGFRVRAVLPTPSAARTDSR